MLIITFRECSLMLGMIEILKYVPTAAVGYSMIINY